MSLWDLGTIEVKLVGMKSRFGVPGARSNRLTCGTGHFEVVSSQNAFSLLL